MNDRIKAGRAASLELKATEAAFARARAARVEAWIAADDPAVRERLHAEVRALADVRAELVGVAASGEMEAGFGE